MIDLEQRFRRVMSNMLDNESLAVSSDEGAAEEFLLWAEKLAKEIVDDTAGLEDRLAEEEMYPRLKAVRLLLRSIGRWVAEASSLDLESRQALWDRAGAQGKLLFGEMFVMPHMADVIEQLPAGLPPREIIQWLKKRIEENESKGNFYG